MSDYSKHFVGHPKPKGKHHSVVVDWEKCSDLDFVMGLRPCTKALRVARSSWDRDPDRARELIVDHFLNRPSPTYSFDFRKKRAKTFPTRSYFYGGDLELEWVRKSLKYEFHDPNARAKFHMLTRKVDWDRALTRDRGSSGWLVMAFGYWALYPAAGYAMTRDAAYAEVLVRCFKRYLEDFPTRASREGLAGGHAFRTSADSPVESCMNAGQRALALTDALYSGIFSALRTEDAFEILKHLWFLADLFERLQTARDGRSAFWRGNHNLFDFGSVPLSLGVTLPEFRCASNLVRGGRKILRCHARDPEVGAIRKDGTSYEHSAQYAFYAAGMLLRALELARLNKVSLFSKAEEQRVRSFFDSFADLTAPDGTLIPYGDCQPPPPGFHLDLARAAFRKTRAEAVVKNLRIKRQAHAPTRERDRTRLNGKLEKAGIFPASGIVVARTGWKPSDSLLFITGDPKSTYSGHSHHDFTSFQLWADGVPLFLDTSTWGYRIDEIIPRERGYYYSAFSHNMLTVEGYRPRSVFKKMGDLSYWGDSEGPPVRTEKCDVEGGRGEVVMSHTAYPGLKVTRRYSFDLAKRKLSFVDEVAAEDTRIRVFRQWLHPAFGAKIQSVRGAMDALTFTCGKVKARCVWESDRLLTLVAEPSPEVERAARVFRKGKPMRSYAECRTRARRFSMACSIQW